MSLDDIRLDGLDQSPARVIVALPHSHPQSQLGDILPMNGNLTHPRDVGRMNRSNSTRVVSLKDLSSSVVGSRALLERQKAIAQTKPKTGFLQKIATLFQRKDSNENRGKNKSLFDPIAPSQKPAPSKLQTPQTRSNPITHPAYQNYNVSNPLETRTQPTHQGTYVSGFGSYHSQGPANSGTGIVQEGRGYDHIKESDFDRGNRMQSSYDKDGWQTIPDEVLMDSCVPQERWEQIPDSLLNEQTAVEFEKSQLSLQMKMDRFGLFMISVPGDGNCQFESIGQQLNPQLKCQEVRSFVVDYIMQNSPVFAEFVDGDFLNYCETMRKDRTYGDHITLQAACDAFNIRVLLATADETNELLQIRPRVSEPKSTVWLAYSHASLHYNIAIASEKTPQDL